MTISRTRRNELKWEAIDAAFTAWEYWAERAGEGYELSDEESDYLQKQISRMAKYIGVTNHVYIT